MRVTSFRFIPDTSARERFNQTIKGPQSGVRPCLHAKRTGDARVATAIWLTGRTRAAAPASAPPTSADSKPDASVCTQAAASGHQRLGGMVAGEPPGRPRTSEAASPDRRRLRCQSVSTDSERHLPKRPARARGGAMRLTTDGEWPRARARRERRPPRRGPGSRRRRSPRSRRRRPTQSAIRTRGQDRRAGCVGGSGVQNPVTTRKNFTVSIAPLDLSRRSRLWQPQRGGSALR
jgi:hypothetical protein